MAVRDFDGVDDFIDLDIGNVLGPVTAFTFVAVFKSDINHAGGLLCALRNSDGVPAWGMNPFNDGKLYGSANGFAGTAYDIGDWVMAGWSKVAGGSQTPRFHHVNLETSTPTHSDGPAGSISDSAIAPVDHIHVGRWAFNAEYLNGKLAALAVFNTALSDGAFNSLSTGLQAMLDAGAVGLWGFDQENVGDPVLDLTENGADQISIVGTSVITDDDPPGFDFGGNMDPIQLGTGSVYDRIMAGLVSQGFTEGSISDREYARLLAKLVLSNGTGKSLADLYELANEPNRLAIPRMVA